jgi:hypothetical protein
MHSVSFGQQATTCLPNAGLMKEMVVPIVRSGDMVDKAGEPRICASIS